MGAEGNYAPNGGMAIWIFIVTLVRLIIKFSEWRLKWWWLRKVASMLGANLVPTINNSASNLLRTPLYETTHSLTLPLSNKVVGLLDCQETEINSVANCFGLYREWTEILTK